MKFKVSWLLILNAATATFGGLSLLLMPEQMMANYGATLNEAGVFMAHILGVTILSIALLSFMVRNVKETAILKPILISFALAHLGAMIIAYQVTAAGVLNQMGYIDAAIHGVLTLGFLYFLLNKKLLS